MIANWDERGGEGEHEEQKRDGALFLSVLGKIV